MGGGANVCRNETIITRITYCFFLNKMSLFFFHSLSGHATYNQVQLAYIKIRARTPNVTNTLLCWLSFWDATFETETLEPVSVRQTSQNSASKARIKFPWSCAVMMYEAPETPTRNRKLPKCSKYLALCHAVNCRKEMPKKKKKKKKEIPHMLAGTRLHYLAMIARERNIFFSLSVSPHGLLIPHARTWEKTNLATCWNFVILIHSALVLCHIQIMFIRITGHDSEPYYWCSVEMLQHLHVDMMILR